MILVNECFCCAFVLFWQWLCSFLFANKNINKFTVHHNEIKDTLLSSMKHMHMYWLMLVGIEIEDKSKILKKSLAYRSSFRSRKLLLYGSET